MAHHPIHPLGFEYMESQAPVLFLQGVLMSPRLKADSMAQEQITGESVCMQGSGNS